MRDFRQLNVWAKAHALALAVYDATRTFPSEELYGLTSQLRRAAMSVPANIAEGCGAVTRAELARYLQIAMKSASELDYHLLLARDLGVLSSENHQKLALAVAEVQRMLASLIRRVRSGAANELQVASN